MPFDCMFYVLLDICNGNVLVLEPWGFEDGDLNENS